MSKEYNTNFVVYSKDKMIFDMIEMNKSQQILKIYLFIKFYKGIKAGLIFHS